MTSPEKGGDPRAGLGRRGENEAARALSGAGMRVVDRRVRLCGAELDLVALDRDVVVFVEVKTRSGYGYGVPAEAVTSRKRARMARAALAWLVRHGQQDRACRFDVVEVLASSGGTLAARHIRDAFRLTPTG